MKMLSRRIPVHRFDALSLFRWRAAIAVRPIISQRRLLSDSPPATTAAAAAEERRRRWVILSSRGLRRPDGTTSVADADDANTVAECRTSTGRRLRVSFRFAAQPAISYLYYDFPPPESSGPYHHHRRVSVAAAHGEFLLLEMDNSWSSRSVERFVYRAAAASGAAGRRPPSLLPVPDIPTNSDGIVVPASFFDGNSRRMGLLRRRRGENDDDLLVIGVHANRPWCASSQQMAVLCVLRPGMRDEWELTEPAVPVLEHGYGGSSPAEVISVCDRFLCWVEYRWDFLLCDMAADDGRRSHSSKVRHMPLPPAVTRCSYGDDYGSTTMRFRRMGAAGDGSVRFVSIHPHCCRTDDPVYGSSADDDGCCCDDWDNHGGTRCWHGRFVFSVRTWTMDLGMDDDDDEPPEWVEDEEIHGEEIWALPGYQGLPQAIPEWPVVCLDDPDVVCFQVSNFHFTREDDDKVWMVQLNVKTKALLSVVQLNNVDNYWDRKRNNYHLPAQIHY